MPYIYTSLHNKLLDTFFNSFSDHQYSMCTLITLSAWPEVRGTADTDGGAYSPFWSILLVLTHDFIIIQLYGPACGDG